MFASNVESVCGTHSLCFCLHFHPLNAKRDIDVDANVMCKQSLMSYLELQVLKKSSNMTLVRMKDLVDRMVDWTENRYIDTGVWIHFSSRIDPAALPANLETLQLPAPPRWPFPLTVPSNGHHPLYLPEVPSAGPIAFSSMTVSNLSYCLLIAG